MIVGKTAIFKFLNILKKTTCFISRQFYKSFAQTREYNLI